MGINFNQSRIKMADYSLALAFVMMGGGPGDGTCYLSFSLYSDLLENMAWFLFTNQTLVERVETLSLLWKKKEFFLIETPLFCSSAPIFWVFTILTKKPQGENHGRLEEEVGQLSVFIVQVSLLFFTPLLQDSWLGKSPPGSGKRLPPRIWRENLWLGCLFPTTTLRLHFLTKRVYAQNACIVIPRKKMVLELWSKANERAERGLWNPKCQFLPCKWCLILQTFITMDYQRLFIWSLLRLIKHY